MKLSDCGYIVKVQLIRFLDRLEIHYKRRRKIKGCSTSTSEKYSYIFTNMGEIKRAVGLGKNMGSSVQSMLFKITIRHVGIDFE